MRIDVSLRLDVRDAYRRFELDLHFASDAPVTALYGPSGAGKTLTLQAIAGLLPPRAGHVRIGGETLFDASRGIDVPASLRGVGYVFQHYALFPHLSVFDNVAFGLTSWRKRRLDAPGRERVEALLDALQLSPLARSRPATLSGGQLQRVALARALACEPRVLLLDEPFAALNASLRAALRDELQRLPERFDLPIVLVTHDLGDVAALANHVVLVDQGRAQRGVDLRDARQRDALLHSLNLTS